jgi:hypothetical protein
LPLQLIFFGLGALLRRKEMLRFAVPLEVVGHVPGIYLAGRFIILSDLVTAPTLIIFGMLLLAAIDFLLAWLHRERWFLFSALLLTALHFLFILIFAPDGPPDALLVYFSMTAVAYGLLGWRIRNSGNSQLAEPIEAAALVVGFSGGIGSLGDGTSNSLNALLVGAIAYAILFTSSRGREYIYLIILSAGAIGFQFVRIAGERFSHQLVDQFLVGLAIVGILFFYPVIRRFVRGEGSFKGWLNDGGWVRVLFVGLPLTIIVPAIGVTYTFEATANPTFCGSCHVMRTQYEAWDRGSHRDVTCDTCHYPPGWDIFVQGKVVGLTEVVNNVAGTFATKPHGTVDNANCESCHPSADLIDLSSPYRAAIKFNHAEIKPENEMDITMRCNNCHSHIVDGFHFQVRESTCYWCHFMGRGEKPTAVGDCFTCHDTPADDTHQEVVDSRNELDCTTAECHVNVTVGSGGVDDQRCLSCHGQIDPSFADAQMMHDLHIVSRTTFLSRKVECLECHDEITHGEEVFETTLDEGGEGESTP